MVRNSARAARRIARLAALAGLAAVCLGIASFAAGVVQASLRNPIEPAETGLFGIYARLSLELESRLGTDAPAGETRIVLGPGGRDVRLSGELTEGAAERLERLLDANASVERIHLTSEGGLVDEGHAIGAAIAEHGLSTYVPDYCVSACTLAFVRGRERHVTSASRLGFHAPYEPGLFGQTFRADGTAERAAYLAAGLAPDFVDAALTVSSDDLWIPKADRLIAAGVATGVVDSFRFPDSTLDDGDEPAQARSALLRNLGLLRAFEARAPEVVDGIADWYRDAYRGGLSEGEAVAGLKRLTARAVSRAMREADDAGLVALGRLLVRAMEAVHASEPATCAAIGAEGDLVLAETVLRKRGARPDESARLLVARALARPARPALVPVALDEDARQPLGPPAGDCATLRRLYAEALSRPPREAATALRGLIHPAAAPRPTLEASMRP